MRRFGGNAIRGVLAGAVFAAGCGSGGGSKPTVTIGPPTRTPMSCAAAGIGIDGAGGVKEGVCTRRRQTLVVADSGHAVDLGDITVRVVGKEAKDKLKQGSATYTTTDHSHTWVVVTVEVTNRSKQIAKPSKEWLLRAGGRKATGYSVNDLVEIKDSFAASPSLAPGQTRKGKLVYDVPKAVAAELVRDAQLIVYSFAEGRRLEKNFFHKPKVAGVLRLYR